MDIEEFQQLQAELAQTKQELGESKGMVKQLLSSLEKDFGCRTLQEAKQLYKQLEREETEYREKAERRLQLYRRKYAS